MSRVITSVHRPDELCGEWVDANGARVLVTRPSRSRTKFNLNVYDAKMAGTEFERYTLTLDHLETWRLVGVMTRVEGKDK